MVRLSAARDASTSPERQREHCRSAIAQRGGVEAGVAEDLDVSATKYSPFERPALGPWLADRADEFDALVVWRLDRLVRSSRDLARLLEWCEQHGKGFVSATEGFDLSTPFGRAMVAIIAALGQLEAETIRERVRDGHRKLRTMDRWASGVPPLGFRPVPHPSGSGVGLATDEDGKRLLHELAERLINGWSYSKLAAWCTETGQLSASDRARIRNGKEPLRKSWTAANVRRVLLSPAAQGFKVRRSRDTYAVPELVLGPDGLPIRMAEPTFDDATWEQIQAAAAARTANGLRRTHSANPMLGIGKCGKCGATLTQVNATDRHGNVRWRSYRCGRTPHHCKNVSYPADALDPLLVELFLSAYGDLRVRRKVFVQGTYNRAEIERLRGAVARLRAESDAGLVDDEAEYLERLRALSGRLRELEADPYRPSRWETVETDQTYAELLDGASRDEQFEILRQADARLDSKVPFVADVTTGEPGEGA
ncbi:recombinase family protein [Amycolatopsis methanolica]|uniref:recombinase family protein n=1 Tax=Amycolatopsis methanolica TaxID=1814 RepID=UPI00342C9710